MSTISSKSFNPYAAPSVPVAEVVGAAKPAKRVSEGVLKFISYAAIVANLGYVMMVAGFFLMVPFLDPSLAEIAMGGYVVSVLGMWVTTVVLAFACRRIGTGILSVFLFLVPFLGTLMFLSTLLAAKELMLKNGYVPGLLGFKPDEEERQHMSADPSYVPHVKVKRDGSKRPTVYMLSECVFLLAIVGFVVSIFATT